MKIKLDENPISVRGAERRWKPMTEEHVPVRLSHLLRECSVGVIVRGPDSLMVVQDHAAAAIHDGQPKAGHRWTVLDTGGMTWPCGDSADPTMRSAVQQDRVVIH